MSEYKEHQPYGMGKVLLNMDIHQLKRLYNSGMMPMPMTRDGHYDFETERKIMARMGLGVQYRR